MTASSQVDATLGSRVGRSWTVVWSWDGTLLLDMSAALLLSRRAERRYACCHAGHAARNDKAEAPIHHGIHGGSCSTALIGRVKALQGATAAYSPVRSGEMLKRTSLASRMLM
jgi:hypothetical protein